MSLSRTATIVFLPTLTFAAVLMTGSADPIQAAAHSHSAAPAPNPAGLTATPTGFMVNPPIASPGEYGPTLAFMNGMAQTKLGFLVASDKGGLISFVHGDSTMEIFADDTGRVLYDPKSHFGPFSMLERVVDDGRGLAVEVDGITIPADGAKTVRAKGTLAVRQAFTKKVHTSERVAFAEGAACTAGPFALEIVGNGEASWGSGFEIEVKTKSDVTGIISWAVITPKGGRVELKPSSTMTMMNTSQITLKSDVELTSGELIIEAWSDAKIVRVPFDSTVRVGAQ